MTPIKMKVAFERLRAAFDGTPDDLLSTLKAIAPSATIHMCAPFGDLMGGALLFEKCYAPLLHAMPDLERRDMIIMAGRTPEGQNWLGAMGNYMGTFLAPFLDIPPTGRIAHMRFHEFYKFDNDCLLYTSPSPRDA